MYLNIEKLTFCTLAVGDGYIEASVTLIQSVLKFTPHRIVVVTDNPYSHHYDYLRNDRLVIVQLEETLPTVRDEIFNYSLKREAISAAMDITPNGGTVIYVDADTFLFGWNTECASAFEGKKSGVYARCRSVDESSPKLLEMLRKKLLHIAPEVRTEDVVFPLEVVMVFNGITPTMRNMIHRWGELIGADVPPDMETVEMYLACVNSGVEIIDTGRFNGFADSFRTLHNGKIHTPLII